MNWKLTTSWRSAAESKKARLGVIAGLALATCFAAVAQETSSDRAASFDAFRGISQQNIFNQYRMPRRRERSRGPAIAPVAETVWLVGTMSYTKGDFAFFDGTGSESRKVAQAGDTIAGYTVTAISTSGVTLERDGQPLEMPVGSRLQRGEDGAWQLAVSGGLPAVTAENPAAAETPAATDGPPAGDQSGGNASDVLKRLRQQREQELK